MKNTPLVVLLMCASIGLVVGAVVAAVLASQVDCGFEPTADCQALQMALWQRAAIPGALGLAGLFARMVLASQAVDAAARSALGAHEADRP